MSNAKPVPAYVTARKALTVGERYLLDAICRANGGGVKLDTVPRTVAGRRLWGKGLIAVKSGMPDRFVHSPKGFAYWRSLQADEVL